MHRVSIFILVSLVKMTAAAAAETRPNNDEPSTFKTPSFVHGLDSPVYTLMETTSDYEVRKYEKSKWVSTTIDGFGFVESQRQGFRRLFKYISGENEKKQKIPMTAPVRSLVTPGDGPFCKNKFTVSFFVPYSFTDTIPTPTSSDVFVEQTPEMTVYVVPFGGYMTGTDVVEKSAKLQGILEKKGIEIDGSAYYACGYDSPFRLIRRHNEIWLVAKESKSIV